MCLVNRSVSMASTAQVSEARQQRLLDACTAACMLLLVKQYLRAAYSLTAERVRQFHPSDSEQRKAEEKLPAACNRAAQLRLATLALDLPPNAAGLEAQGKVSGAADVPGLGKARQTDMHPSCVGSGKLQRSGGSVWDSTAEPLILTPRGCVAALAPALHQVSAGNSRAALHHGTAALLLMACGSLLLLMPCSADPPRRGHNGVAGLATSMPLSSRYV